MVFKIFFWFFDLSFPQLECKYEEKLITNSEKEIFKSHFTQNFDFGLILKDGI